MGKPARRAMRPATYHGLVSLTLTVLIGAGIFLLFRVSLSWPHLLAGWLVGVNVVAFGYYAYDKSQAGGSGQRVPEVVLHGLALVGGSPGAWLGMRLFRHKTIKGGFRFVFWCIVVLQLALIGWIGWIVFWS
jgi:uncharacterized membrane protein YsdA (DUF1294 family)